MVNPRRHGNRWTINECLQLQREYELLELSIDEIAKRHKRTPYAIMSRLAHENLADLDTLYSKYHGVTTNSDSESEVEDDLEEVVEDDSDYKESEDEEEEDDSDYKESESESEDESEEDSDDELIRFPDFQQHSLLIQKVFKLEKELQSLTALFKPVTKSKR